MAAGGGASTSSPLAANGGGGGGSGASGQVTVAVQGEAEEAKDVMAVSWQALTGQPPLVPAGPAAASHEACLPTGPQPAPPQPRRLCLLQVLGDYLSSHAMQEAKEDPQRAAFEAAVLKFVRGEYRAAATQLQASHVAARNAARWDLAGDALRWLGHAHNKLGDAARAAACFAQGCELAEAHSLRKLQASCRGRGWAGGGGCCRGRGLGPGVGPGLGLR